MSEAVIILFYTIMDGPVLRWYHSDAAAKHGSDYMSVSRNGVHISEFLDRIPEEEIAKAKRAARELNRDRRADVSSFATHDKSFGGGRLERIAREEPSS